MATGNAIDVPKDRSDPKCSPWVLPQLRDIEMLDNFLGYEELTEEERKEIEEICKEIKRGGYVKFGELFDK